MSVGLNSAYLFKSEYDPTEDMADDELDPGDQILVVILFKWQVSSRMKLDSFLTYSHFSEDTIDGKKTFQEGDKIAFGGNIQVNPGPLKILTGCQYILQAKNKVLGLETLETEPKNSNGADLFGSFDVWYGYSPKFSVRVLGDVRFYGKSEREDTEKGIPFAGRRIRYAFGPGFFLYPEQTSHAERVSQVSSFEAGEGYPCGSGDHLSGYQLLCWADVYFLRIRHDTLPRILW